MHIYHIMWKKINMIPTRVTDADSSFLLEYAELAKTPLSEIISLGASVTLTSKDAFSSSFLEPLSARSLRSKNTRFNEFRFNSCIDTDCLARVEFEIVERHACCDCHTIHVWNVLPRWNSRIQDLVASNDIKWCWLLSQNLKEYILCRGAQQTNYQWCACEVFYNDLKPESPHLMLHLPCYQGNQVLHQKKRIWCTRLARCQEGGC